MKTTLEPRDSSTAPDAVHPERTYTPPELTSYGGIGRLTSGEIDLGWDEPEQFS